MKTWHIWDFPDTVYIYLEDNTREEFFETTFKKLGGKRPSAKYPGITQSTIKEYHKGHTYKNGIEHPQAIPISFLRKSLPLINEKLKEKVEDNIVLVKAKNKGSPIINPKLPIKESPELYRIVAHMIGDGSAPGRKVPYYANTCKELREQFKKDLNIFGKVKIYERRPQTTEIVFFPKVITDILSHILKIKFSHPEHIPKQIFNAPKECKYAFLQALFDDEGTISTNLSIGMKSRILIEEIKTLLKNLDIETTITSLKQDKYGGNYTFNIKSKYIKKFKDRIDFLHPEKYRKLIVRINITNRNNIKRTRPLEWTRKEILRMLEIKPMTTLELSEQLLLTVSGLYHHLKPLEETGDIQKEGHKNRATWRTNHNLIQPH